MHFQPNVSAEMIVPGAVLPLGRHLARPTCAIGRSMQRLIVSTEMHAPWRVICGGRHMRWSWVFCYFAILSMLSCFSAVSAAFDTIKPLRSATPHEGHLEEGELQEAWPEKGVGARTQPLQDAVHKMPGPAQSHVAELRQSEEEGTLMPEFWDSATAFQPSHPLAGLEFESMATVSYRGPGNNDTRRNKELPILLWWSENLFPHFPGETERIDCPRSSCLATKNKKVKLHKRTKSVIFYGTDFRAYEAPLPRLPHQSWALFHEESPMNNYLLSHLPGISLFNYTATFRRESDYPLSLQWLPNIEYLQNPAVPLVEKNEWEKRGHAPVLYMQSHCDVPSDRDRYVEELMKYIKVDSYGKCLNNRKLPDERLEDTSTATTEDSEFMAFVSKYKFHLAMENALCPDYMTEKLWRPMHLGAIPIYRGSPSVLDWMPNNYSIILIDDFPSPQALADFIVSLDSDDDKYLRYLEYKKPGGVTNQFLLKNLEEREWGVNDMSVPNYLNGFECFVCDQENRRAEQERQQGKFGGRVTLIASRIGKYNHMGCPMPMPGIGNVEDVPENDSWKQMWLQDYWQSLDQGEALSAMIRQNEIDQGRFWDYMHEIFMRRNMQH